MWSGVANSAVWVVLTVDSFRLTLPCPTSAQAKGFSGTPSTKQLQQHMVKSRVNM